MDEKVPVCSQHEFAPSTVIGLTRLYCGKSILIAEGVLRICSRGAKGIWFAFRLWNTFHLITNWITRCYFHSHFGYNLVYWTQFLIYTINFNGKCDGFLYTRLHTETITNYICHKFWIMWLHARAQHIVWLGSFFIVFRSCSHYTIPNQPFFTFTLFVFIAINSINQPRQKNTFQITLPNILARIIFNSHMFRNRYQMGSPPLIWIMEVYFWRQHTKSHHIKSFNKSSKKAKLHVLNCWNCHESS